MKTERELFDEVYRKSHPSDKCTLLPSGNYSGNVKQLAWDFWQASANREGYKLVPIEPTEEIKDAMCGYECNTDDEIVGCYKAMIGAVE